MSSNFAPNSEHINLILEAATWGIVLLGLSFLPVSLGYKPTKLKVLASVSLLILSEVVTLAFLQNYIMATFILFIYVGAIIVLFTVVLLTNPEAAVRVNPYVTRTPDALILFLWVVMYTHFPKFWEELLDHKFALVARVNSTIKLEDYVKYERLAELQKTSANDLLSISSLLTAHWELVMLGGLLLITAMVVVMKLVGEFLVSKGSIEKTGRNINHSNL